MITYSTALNIALVGSIFWAFFSLLASFSEAQADWKSHWSQHTAKPEFSYSAEGFKLQDVKALRFFLLKEYEEIPDKKYRNLCLRVRKKLFFFPALIVLLIVLKLMA